MNKIGDSMKITAKQIAKTIKNIDIKDKLEIIKRVAKLLGRDKFIDVEVTVANYLELEECYNIAMGALEVERNSNKGK